MASGRRSDRKTWNAARPSVIEAPALPGMSAFELMATNISATGVTADYQPMALIRERMEELGIVPADRLLEVEDGTRLRIAGIVTHRQRPQTASGLTFLGMEIMDRADECDGVRWVVAAAARAGQKCQGVDYSRDCAECARM